MILPRRKEENSRSPSGMTTRKATATVGQEQIQWNGKGKTNGNDKSQKQRRRF
jgi:hypothetical protein